MRARLSEVCWWLAERLNGAADRLEMLAERLVAQKRPTP